MNSSKEECNTLGGVNQDHVNDQYERGGNQSKKGLESEEDTMTYREMPEKEKRRIRYDRRKKNTYDGDYVKERNVNKPRQKTIKYYGYEDYE